jgi:hypothetical protein
VYEAHDPQPRHLVTAFVRFDGYGLQCIASEALYRGIPTLALLLTSSLRRPIRVRVSRLPRKNSRSNLRQILDSWNKQFSEGDPRRYPDVRNFRRDFARGQRVVIGTEWGLPGIPGQPMSAEEKRKEAERSRGRIMTFLKAYEEKHGNTPLPQQ